MFEGALRRAAELRRVPPAERGGQGAARRQRRPHRRRRLPGGLATARRLRPGAGARGRDRASWGRHGGEYVLS